LKRIRHGKDRCERVVSGALQPGEEPVGLFFFPSTVYYQDIPLIPVAASGSYPMNVVTAYTSVSLMNGIYTLSQPQIPADIDSGLYRIKITLFGQNTATMSYPIRVYYPGPDIQPLYTASPKQGEPFTLKANYSSILKGLDSFSLLVNGSYMPLKILSITNGSATIQVPDDFPPGVYNNFRLVCEGYDAKVYANGTRGSLTVQPK